jgi:hypothetical protein
MENQEMIAKIVVGSAIALGAAVGWAASASADPSPSPFGTLSCSCPETAPAGSPVLTEKIDQGIQQGLSGLPVDQYQ